MAARRAPECSVTRGSGAVVLCIRKLTWGIRDKKGKLVEGCGTQRSSLRIRGVQWKVNRIKHSIWL